MLPICVCVKRPARSQSCSKTFKHLFTHSGAQLFFLVIKRTYGLMQREPTKFPSHALRGGVMFLDCDFTPVAGFLASYITVVCMTTYNWFATLVSFVCTCCSSFWPKHVFVKRWHYITVWEILTHVWKKIFWTPPKWKTCKFKQTIKKGVQNWDENFSHSLCGHKSYVFVFHSCGRSVQCIHAVSVWAYLYSSGAFEANLYVWIFAAFGVMTVSYAEVLHATAPF